MRYNRAGIEIGPGGKVLKKAASDPVSIEKELRDLDRRNAETKARREMERENKVITPMRVARRAEGLGKPEEQLKNEIVKAQLVNERSLRDNKRRKGKEYAIRTRTGPAPSEPGRMGGPIQPATSPTGSTVSGDRDGDTIARERYNRNLQSLQQDDDYNLAAQIRRMRGIR